MITKNKLKYISLLFNKAHYFIDSTEPTLESLKGYSKTLLLSYFPKADAVFIKDFYYYCQAYSEMRIFTGCILGHVCSNKQK